MWRKILGARCNFTKHTVKPRTCRAWTILPRLTTATSPLIESFLSAPFHFLSKESIQSPLRCSLPPRRILPSLVTSPCRPPTTSFRYPSSIPFSPSSTQIGYSSPSPTLRMQPYCLLWTRVARLPQVCIETWIFQMEEQFILRVPPSVAERIERLLNENASSSADGALDISFSGNPSTGYLLISWSKFWKIILCTSNDRW